MKIVFSQTDPQFERLSHIMDIPLPASAPLTDPKYFLGINEDAIILRLNESKREQRRITLTKFSAVFGVFTAIAMLLTFSREARAFVRDVFYSVAEWFSPEQNESGVTFDIKDSTHSFSPDASQIESGEKQVFKDLSEVDKLYSHSIFAMDNAVFSLSDGYIQDKIICLNYKTDVSHVQIIAEPIQSSGSIVCQFNDAEFDKTEVAELGTFYHRLEDDGTLFGCIMTDDTSIIVRADNASSDLLDQIVHSICRYR